MVSGISAATSAVNAAYARYDQAAGAVVADTSTDASNTGDIAGDIVQMDTSQIAVAAALMVAKKSNDMLSSTLELLGYGVSASTA
jgi:hypothetical protein